VYICREITELVTDYLEEHLSFGERLRFQFHLGMCRHCRAYLRQMKMTVKIVNRLRGEAFPPPLPPELLQRFKQWRRR